MSRQTHRLIDAQLHPKALAVLIDPEKERDLALLEAKCQKINELKPDMVLLGGSHQGAGNSAAISKFLSQHLQVPLIGFPGNAEQVSSSWDGILFLNLISAEKSKYLFKEQYLGVPEILHASKSYKIYPTGYLLLDGGHQSSTSLETDSNGICQEQSEEVVQRCLTSYFLGQNHLYLEAGSGAKNRVHPQLIIKVKSACDAYLIVGGGIREGAQAIAAWNSGADLVVVGTALEEQFNRLTEFIDARNKTSKPC